MSMQKKRHACIAALMLSLAACGTTPAERGVSGGALGAAGGAAIGSLSGNAGAGAVIGGVAGAATGLLTTPPPQSQAYDGYYDRNGIYHGTRCVRWAPSGACVEARNF
jgi:osmotically inducible lipoprotein OsmB